MSIHPLLFFYIAFYFLTCVEKMKPAAYRRFHF